MVHYDSMTEEETLKSPLKTIKYALYIFKHSVQQSHLLKYPYTGLYIFQPY